MMEIENSFDMANRLVLQLKGFEENEFYEQICGRAQIIDLEIPIAVWTEGNVIEPGQYCFPF